MSEANLTDAVCAGSSADTRVPGVRSESVLLAGVVLAGVIAALGIGPLRDALALQDYAATLASPYLVPGHAMLLYLAAPVVTMAIAVFLSAPGLLLAAATGSRKGPAAWLLSAFGWNLAVLVPAVTIVQLAAGTALRGPAFLALIALLALAAVPLLLRRAASGSGLALDLAGKRADLVFALAVPVATLLAFSAKFYWEDFTPDGAEGLHLARLYTETLWPFWPHSAGAIGESPDLTSLLFVIPDSWFQRVIGDYEFAVRAPMLPALGLIHVALVALIRFGRERAVGIADQLIIGATLLLYTLAVVYSGGYFPWFNDSPEPAVRETLSVAVFLGFVLFLVERRPAWTGVFALLAIMSIPTGRMWVLLVPAAMLLVWRSDSRPPVRTALLVAVATIVVLALGPLAIHLSGLPEPGTEFGLIQTLHRLRFVSLDDWSRLGYFLIPGGIVPAAALLAWRRQDGLSRTLTVTTVVIFLFFWFQAYRILLHHFVPVMLVPIVIYWRTLVLPAQRPMLARGAAVAGLVAAFWLAWPMQMGLHSFDRDLGSRVAMQGPLFGSPPKGPGERFPRFDPAAYDVVHTLMLAAFPIDYGVQGPAHAYFGGPLVWYYYAMLPRQPGSAAEYDIRPLAMPGEGTLRAQYHGYGLYIRDPAEYARDRAPKLPFDTGSPFLATNRGSAFGTLGTADPRIVIDLARLLPFHRHKRPAAG